MGLYYRDSSGVDTCVASGVQQSTGYTEVISGDNKSLLSSTDTKLTFVDGDGITITGDATTNKLTVSADVATVAIGTTGEDTDALTTVGQVEDYVGDIQPGWTGTKAEYQTAYAAGEIKEGEIVNITDDFEDPGDLTIDDSLSTTSENPVQNKVITTDLKTRTLFDEAGYVSGTTYAVNTMIKHNGYVWIAIAETTTEPSDTATDWLLMAACSGATISNSTAITTEGSYALDAIQNNASVTGTLAKRLADLEASSGDSCSCPKYIHGADWFAKSCNSIYTTPTTASQGFHFIVGGYTYSVVEYIRLKIDKSNGSVGGFGRNFANGFDINFSFIVLPDLSNAYVSIKGTASSISSDFHFYYDSSYFYAYLPILNSTADFMLGASIPTGLIPTIRIADITLEDVYVYQSLPTDLTEIKTTYTTIS